MVQDQNVGIINLGTAKAGHGQTPINLEKLNPDRFGVALERRTF
jgi:hypothetical protein